MTPPLWNTTGLMVIHAFQRLQTGHASRPGDLTGVDDRVGPRDGLKVQGVGRSFEDHEGPILIEAGGCQAGSRVEIAPPKLTGRSADEVGDAMLTGDPLVHVIVAAQDDLHARVAPEPPDRSAPAEGSAVPELDRGCRQVARGVGQTGSSPLASLERSPRRSNRVRRS